jgi:RimJ/RimL family protein N-acetyltransferase
MDIRRLDPTLARAYRVLMLEGYRLHPEAFTSSVAEREAQPIAWWEARLTSEPRPAQLVLGAFQDSTLAGVAGLSFETREKIRHKATLFGMYVPTTARGKGLGAQLVRAVLAEAASRPEVKVVQLTVTDGNRHAQRLYERCGFIQFGVEPFAVSLAKGFASKVHMWHDIDAYRDTAKV